MTLTQLIAESREREKAATPGPWLRFAGCLKHGSGLVGVNGPNCKEESSDSKFIAHARTELPLFREMLAVAVEALEKTADLENPYELKYIAAPACEYMKASRDALATLDKMVREKEETKCTERRLKMEIEE